MVTDYRDIAQDEHSISAKAKRSLLVDSLGNPITSTNKLPVEASIVIEDIEIGAVELKNATDDTRAVVKSDGVNNALVVTQNSQPLPTGAATELTLTDKSQMTNITDGTTEATVDIKDTSGKGLNTINLLRSSGTYLPFVETEDFLLAGETYPPISNADGIQEVRSAILTDEGSFYDSFPGTTLAPAWTVVQGAGTSYSVSNSQLILNSGTTANSEIVVSLELDYIPVKLYIDANISQRIANQEICFGLCDSPDSSLVTQYARWYFRGTTDTVAICETQSHTGTGGKQTTNVVVNSTAVSQDFLVSLTEDRASFSKGTNNPFSMEIVAAHMDELPNPYTPLYVRFRIKNGAIAPASNTQFIIDLVKVTNYNMLEVGNTGSGQSIATQLLGFDGTIDRPIVVDTQGRLITTTPNINGDTITLNYQADIGVYRINTFRNVLTYTIPTGYTANVISFLSTASNSYGYGRLVRLINFGTYNIGTQTFSNGNALTGLKFISKVETEVTTINSGVVVITITYVNQDGVGGRTGTATVLAGSVVGERALFTLQARDYGVQDITAVSRGSVVTGVITLYGIDELAFQKDDTSQLVYESIFPSQGVIIPSGVDGIIGIEFSATTAAAVPRQLKSILSIFKT